MSIKNILAIVGSALLLVSSHQALANHTITFYVAPAQGVQINSIPGFYFRLTPTHGASSIHSCNLQIRNVDSNTIWACDYSAADGLSFKPNTGGQPQMRMLVEDQLIACAFGIGDTEALANASSGSNNTSVVAIINGNNVNGYKCNYTNPIQPSSPPATH